VNPDTALEVRFTSVDCPPIGCPVWPGRIAPKHAIRITAFDEAPFTKPKNR
jgi:hypothetical protein